MHILTYLAMKISSHICICVTLVLLARPCQPADQLLTLNDCIRLARSVPSIWSVAQKEREIAGYGLTQARSGFLPQLRWGSGITYNSPLLNNRSEFSFVALNGIREYTSQFVAVEELDTSGRLRSAWARARAEQDAAAADETVSERDLRRAVTTAYYQLLLARRLVEVNRAALEEARSFEGRTRLLFQNGEAAQADVAKAASQVAFFEQSQRAAELDAEMANHRLASFWTENVSDPLQIEDVFDKPLPPPDPPPGGPSVFLRRPEFRFLEAQRRAYLADAKRARAELFPQASLVFQYGIDSLRFNIQDRGYAAFVNLNIPVFDWMRSRSQEHQSLLRAQQVDTTRQITTRNFSREYQDALARVRAIYDQIMLTASQIKLSEENLRLSRLRYEGGEGSALDVVAAQSQLAQAQSNHYAAIANYLNAKADLEAAAGL